MTRAAAATAARRASAQENGILERRASAPVNPWRILTVALTAQVGISVIDQGIPTLTGFIKADLGLSATTAGLVVSSFAFGKIFGAYAAGRAADRIGERRVLVGGGLATAVLVALAALSPLPLLLVLLVLGGTAGASSTPAGGRLVLLAFPRNRHGLALGIRQTGIPLGGLVAAGLLPWLAHRADWRWSLLLAAGVALAALVPLWLTRTDRVAGEERPSDRVAAAPARDRNVGLLTLWGCLLVSGQYALLAFLALDLHHSSGFGLAAASLFVVVANVSGVVGRVAWGALSDRALARGRKPLLLVLTAVGLLGALLLLATPRSAPAGVLVVVAAVAGLALIGYQGLWVTMIAEAAGPQRVGAAMGFAVTFVTVSIAASPPLYGLVADATGSYRAIWAALAGVLALAFVPAAFVHERRA
jgi:predicted MFS family arabinose efflux permease